MSTLQDRLKELMDAYGLKNQVELAKFAGVSKGLVGQWFKGDTGLGSKPLRAFEEKTNFSMRWLIDGTGEKYRDKAAIEENIEPNATVIGGLDPWDSRTSLGEDDIEVPFYKEICLSAGNGFADDIEDHNGYKLRFSRSTLRRYGINPVDVVCVSADGNSMEPVFPDGATLGINTAEKSIKDGKIYAFNHGGWLRTKILYRLPDNMVRVRSYNSEEHPDEERSMDEIAIIGRVFWWSVMD
ncbi:TPA: S24 family peptidase [Neisseria weaveri]